MNRGRNVIRKKVVSSSFGVENFVNTLDALKEDYTCGVCKQLCKKPVTLSKCFHLICAEHFEGLKNCPNCNISLEGCTTYVEERLDTTIEAAQKLNAMVAVLRENNRKSPKTKGKKKDLIDRRSFDSSANAPSDHDQNPDYGKALSNSKTNKVTANISLLSTSSKIEKKNTKGESLLHIACRLGKVDRIIDLLNQGANANTKDNAGWTPLHEVVQNNKLDIVKLLLQYNALINVPGPSNETPLHEAVRYQHEEIVEELVKNGADMHIRNCKGETPYQLANVDMKNLLRKAADHIVQTQSVNISHMSALYSELDFDDIHIYCVTEFRSIQSKLKTLAKHHSNVHIEVKFSKRVTHLIVDVEDKVCLSSVDVLQGVMSSLWLLSTEWVMKSTEEKLESFENYEVKGIGSTLYEGPKKSRYNKYRQLPGLFNGCHFYLHNFTNKYEISKSLIITKAILAKLITDAGGVVLRRVPNPESIPENEKLVPYHAEKGGKLVNCSHYIIFRDMYEPMYNMQHIKALPVAWLINCMEKYELCDP